MNKDINLIYEAYKKTCLEYVDPDAAEAVRKDREDRQRDKERKRDYNGGGYRSNDGPQGDYPSSRAGYYRDDEDAETQPLVIGTNVIMVKPPGEMRSEYPGKNREGLKGKIENIDTGDVSGLGSKTTYHIRLIDGTPKGKLITYVQPKDFKVINPGEEAAEEPNKEEIIDQVIEMVGDYINDGYINNREDVNDLLGGSVLFRAIIGDGVEAEFNSDGDDFEEIWKPCIMKLRKLPLNDFEGWDKNVQGENAEEHNLYTCNCPKCMAEKKRRADYVKDHGGDEDAEEHNLYTCNCPKCMAEKKRRADYVKDHGGDEDAESSNINIDTLIDTIKEYQVKSGNREHAYAYVVGVLGTLIKEALHSPKDLQNNINRSYRSFAEKV